MLKYVILRGLNKVFLSLGLILMASCEESTPGRTDDIRMIVTNKTDQNLLKIWIRGADGTRSWYYQNIEPGISVGLTFNVREHFNVAQGDVTITAFTSPTDSLQLKTGYFTDYKYQGPPSSTYFVYDDRIEIQ